MEGPDKISKSSLEQLSKLVELAERERLYLDLTGLGCYHKQAVPGWYDALLERERWEVQARFWQAVAHRVEKSPAIFCFDLMNEPVVPGGKRDGNDWLGPPFAGKHFVQFITLDQRSRGRSDIAREWIRFLIAAIRQEDRRHLITVGLVDWSLDRPGLTSGFIPEKIGADLDFLSVHLYPEKGKLADAKQTLKGFQLGKPVVIEETFPLNCSAKELRKFIGEAQKEGAGWISFYWGKPPEALKRSRKPGDAILLEWLNEFQSLGREYGR